MIVTGTILSFTFIEVVPTVTGLLIYAFLKEFKKCALLNCWDGGEFISGYALYEGLIWGNIVFWAMSTPFFSFLLLFSAYKGLSKRKKDEDACRIGHGQGRNGGESNARKYLQDLFYSCGKGQIKVCRISL